MREARGLDVPQKTVVACILRTKTARTVHCEVPRFGTMTADLQALKDWLNAHRVEQVAMESTGVYWRPVFKLLEADHEIILATAQQRKETSTPRGRIVRNWTLVDIGGLRRTGRNEFLNRTSLVFAGPLGSSFHSNAANQGRTEMDADERSSQSLGLPNTCEGLHHAHA
jgi:hypothetical protein